MEETSKSGLLGLISGKTIKIRVTEKEDIGQAAGLFLREMLVNMGVLAQVEVSRRKENTTLNINGKDLGLLIGKHGQTLDAIQYLVNLSVNKNQTEKERIIVDVEGYAAAPERNLTPSRHPHR